MTRTTTVYAALLMALGPLALHAQRSESVPDMERLASRHGSLRAGCEFRRFQLIAHGH